MGSICIYRALQCAHDHWHNFTSIFLVWIANEMLQYILCHNTIIKMSFMICIHKHNNVVYLFQMSFRFHEKNILSSSQKTVYSLTGFTRSTVVKLMFNQLSFAKWQMNKMNQYIYLTFALPWHKFKICRNNLQMILQM